MEELIIYHNNSCSKSQGCLEIIVDSGIKVTVVDYLMDDITEEQLTELVRKLGIPASDLVRKNEEIYQKEYEGKELSDEEWIKAMIAHRELIQRPVVVKGDKAIIARPPERIYELMKE